VPLSSNFSSMDFTHEWLMSPDRGHELEGTLSPPPLPPDGQVIECVNCHDFLDVGAVFSGQSRNTPCRHSPLAQSHSKWQLSYLSPRLGVLNNILAIPAGTSVSIFRNFVFNDAMEHSGYGSSSLSSRRAINHMAMLRRGQIGSGKTKAQVRREVWRRMGLIGLQRWI
jgi:hypothetical protein